jgi:hypothetical protein
MITIINIIFNKIIDDGCSKRRPDVLIDLFLFTLIVECDENQHKHICECEEKRIYEIIEDLKYKNTIFIRFNPDSYYDLDGDKINSSWILDEEGRIQLNYAKISDWNNRLQILKDTIQYWLDNRPEKLIEVVQLFYDQNF